MAKFSVIFADSAMLLFWEKNTIQSTRLGKQKHILIKSGANLVVVHARAMVQLHLWFWVYCTFQQHLIPLLHSRLLMQKVVHR